jgi:glucan endo-1,3-alpha-glucosidase
MANCQSKGFTYAGLQYGKQCYCSNSLQNANMVTSGCSTPCAGDKNIMCGGNYRMNIYQLTSTSTSAAPAGTTPAVGGGGGSQATVTFTATVTVTQTVNTCAAISTGAAKMAKRHFGKFEGRKYPLPKHLGRD